LSIHTVLGVVWSSSPSRALARCAGKREAAASHGGLLRYALTDRPHTGEHKGERTRMPRKKNSTETDLYKRILTHLEQNQSCTIESIAQALGLKRLGNGRIHMLTEVGLMMREGIVKWDPPPKGDEEECI